MSKPRSRPRPETPPPRPSPPAPPAGAGAAPPASRAARLALAGMMAAYAGVFGSIAVVKFRYYLYSDFDLAIFAQATDQALRGNLFSSIRGMHWLGDHSSLILFVIAPLYALFRHPLTLLLLQCVTLALGALPVFALARRELGNERIALAFAALFLIHPAIGYTNLFEFHPEVLATTTLLATFWAVAAGRLGLTVLFAALSVACREDVALVVLMMGLVLLPAAGRRRFAVPLLALAVASLVLTFAVLRPMFASTAAEYGRMYEAWGSDLGEVALGVLREPWRAVASFVSSPGYHEDTLLKRQYWLHMFGPLLFLPLLSPATLVVALPVLAEHFLSARAQQHWLIYQYTALVTPVLVVAAVRGFGTLMRRVARGPLPAALTRPGRPRAVALGIAGTALAASLACNLLYGPLLRQGWLAVPGLPQPNGPSAHDRMRRPVRDRMVARVPREGGVVAAFEFLSRLASRRDVHSLHHLYTGFHTFSTEPYPVPEGVVAMLADVGDERLARYVKPGTPGRLRALMARNDLRPVDAAGDLLLLLRAAPDTVELFRAGIPPPAGAAPAVTWDGQLRLAGVALPETTVAAGGELAILTWWERVADPDRPFMTQFIVRDAAGRTVLSVVRALGYLLYPVESWPADTTVRETYRLMIPAHLPPGEYLLGLRVAWWREGASGLSQPDDPGLAERKLVVPLAGFRVVR